MNIIQYFKGGVWKGDLRAFGFRLGQAKPELMLAGGIVGVLGGTIYACTKTEKAKKEIAEYKEANEKTKQMALPNVDEKQLQMAKGKSYLHNTGVFAYKMLKIYGIPALLWFGGMGLIVGSHGELRKINKHLVAESIGTANLFKEYRERVAKAVGDEVEQKIFLGAQEGKVPVVEIDEKTGKEKIVEQKADIFYAQPGSPYARNFTEATSDCFDRRDFAERYLEARISQINIQLEGGRYRYFNGVDVLRALGYNENALGDDEEIDRLMKVGISGNGRKVPDPEMRKLKVTRLRGYEKVWDVARGCEVYRPCLRLDFNFYPLEGKV